MAVPRAGGTPETGDSPGTPNLSFRQRRWARKRIVALASAAAAVGSLMFAVLPTTALATVTPATVIFKDKCNGTVSVEVVNPAGNGPIAVSYGVPSSFLSVFTSQTPDLLDFTDIAVTLGTWIQPSVAGQVHGIRWYFPATPGSAPIGLLYSAAGVELARATFSSPVAGTWNEVQFPSPVAVGAGDFVMAAVYAPERYVATVGLFSSSGVTNGVLSAPATGAGPPVNTGNGAFNYSGGDAGFPSSTFNGASYFADVLFTEGGVVDDDGVLGVITVPTGAGQISVTGAGLDLTHTWSQPGDCATATTPVSTTSTTGETLPATGSSLIGLLWTGAALLLSGLAVVLFASDARSRRERRTRA